MGGRPDGLGSISGNGAALAMPFLCFYKTFRENLRIGKFSCGFFYFSVVKYQTDIFCIV